MTHRAIARGKADVSRLLRAVAGLIVLALLVCVWAIIIDETGTTMFQKS